MGNVELDGAATTRFQVREQQAAFRPEQVTGVGLAVQQLLADSTGDDRSPKARQRVAEKLPVGVVQLRALRAIVNQPPRLLDTIREVRCRQID